MIQSQTVDLKKVADLIAERVHKAHDQLNTHERDEGIVTLSTLLAKITTAYNWIYAAVLSPLPYEDREEIKERAIATISGATAGTPEPQPSAVATVRALPRYVGPPQN